MKLKHRIIATARLKMRIAESRERLYRVALAWCGDVMLADELVQDTIATGITHSKQLRDKDRLHPWLYTILKNKWFRHIQRRHLHEDQDNLLISKEAGSFLDCQELEMVERVRQAVACLPDKERQVISFVDLDELSYCDVADILDIPIGTVMNRLHRARKILLMKIEHASISPSNAKPLLRIVE